MNADQREKRFPTRSHTVRTIPEMRNVSAARMWIMRIVDMTLPPGGIRNGSAM